MVEYTQWLWTFVGVVLGILSVGTLIFFVLILKEVRLKKIRNRRLLIRLDTAKSMLKEDMPFDALRIYQEIEKMVDATDNKEIFIEIKKGEAEGYLKLYNKTSKIDYLDRAISSFDTALQHIDANEMPSDFFDVQFMLGNLYIKRAEHKDKDKNLKKGIQLLESSLITLEGQETELQKLAHIQRLLGKAYYDTISSDDIEGIKKAIKYNEDALNFYTYEAFPINFAEISVLLGDLYDKLSDKENKSENLTRSMLYFRQALSVFSSGDFLKEFAEIQMNLADGYIKLSRIEDKNRNLMNAIISYEEALKYYTSERDSKVYVEIHRKLSEIYETFASDSNESEKVVDNLEKAVDSLKKALFICERQNIAEETTEVLIRLGDILLKNYEHLKSDKILKEALDCYKKANNLIKKDINPFEYALTKKKIGDIYKIFARITSWSENMAIARQSYVEALKIFSIDKYPFWYKEVKSAMDDIDRLTF